MADALNLGDDLLVNLNQAAPPAAAPEVKLDTLEVPFEPARAHMGTNSVAFGDSVPAPAAASTPNIVPEDFGGPRGVDGFNNFNSFMPKETRGAAPRVLSNTELAARKREFIRKFERRSMTGRPPSRRYTLDDSLESMEEEWRAMQAESNTEFFVEMMSTGVITAAGAAEKAASNFPRLGVNLDKYSQNVMDNNDQLLPIYEEIIDEHFSEFKMSPLAKLGLVLMRTAYMTHVTNQMTKEFGPRAGDVLKNNPQLAKDFMQAYAATTEANATAGGPGPAATSSFMPKSPDPPAPRAVKTKPTTNAYNPADSLAAMSRYIGQTGFGGSGPPSSLASLAPGLGSRAASAVPVEPRDMRGPSIEIPPAAPPSAMKKPSSRKSVTVEF